MIYDKSTPTEYSLQYGTRTGRISIVSRHTFSYRVIRNVFGIITHRINQNTPYASCSFMGELSIHIGHDTYFDHSVRPVRFEPAISLMVALSDGR